MHLHPQREGGRWPGESIRFFDVVRSLTIQCLTLNNLNIPAHKPRNLQRRRKLHSPFSRKGWAEDGTPALYRKDGQALTLQSLWPQYFASMGQCLVLSIHLWGLQFFGSAAALAETLHLLVLKRHHLYIHHLYGCRIFGNELGKMATGGAPWQRSIDIRFDQISNKMNSSPISLHQWQWKEMKRHYRGSPPSHLVEEFRFEMPSKTSSDQECSPFSAWLRTMWYHVESQKPLEMATKTMQVSRSNSPKSKIEKRKHIRQV